MVALSRVMIIRLTPSPLLYSTSTWYPVGELLEPVQLRAARPPLVEEGTALNTSLPGRLLPVSGSSTSSGAGAAPSSSRGSLIQIRL